MKISKANKVFLTYIAIIIGVVILAKADLSKEVLQPVLMGIGFVALTLYIRYEIKTLEVDKMCPSIDNRFKRIEHNLGMLDEPNDDDISRKVAYRVDLSLQPHWIEILKEDAKRQGKKYEQLQEEIRSSGEFENNKKGCLFGKNFRFIKFRDEHTGLRQTWSCHDKCFVDDTEISGWLFTDFMLLPEPKFRDSCLGKHVEFSERGASFWDYGDAKIPCSRIVYFLLALAKYSYSANEYLIKKFPEKLEKELKDNNVRYDSDPLSYDEDYRSSKPINTEEHQFNDDKWSKHHGIQLYNEDVDKHCFHTPFYSICISLSLFGPYSENTYPMPKESEGG